MYDPMDNVDICLNEVVKYATANNISVDQAVLDTAHEYGADWECNDGEFTIYSWGHVGVGATPYEALTDYLLMLERADGLEV